MLGRSEKARDGFAGGSEVTHDLVRRAESKLLGLHANRSQLRRRIRALHYLLKTLDTSSLSKSTEPSSHPWSVKSKINHDEGYGLERDSISADTSSIAANETTTGTPAVTGVSTELRRACRIALMESDRPQCYEQILQRIRRRESVCIKGLRDPVTAIAHQLREMLADGEVIANEENRHWHLNRDSGRFIAQCHLEGK